MSNLTLNDKLLDYLIYKKGLRACEIFFTNKCNLNCKYCYVPENKNEVDHKKFLPVWNDLFEGIFSRYKEKHFSISIWGMEPLVDPEYMFSFLKNLDVLLEKYDITSDSSFSTNGVFFSDEDNADNYFKHIKDIKNIRMDRMQISYDGSIFTKELRGISSEVILNAVKNIKQSSKKYGIRTNLSIKPTLLLESISRPDFVENLKTIVDMRRFINPFDAVHLTNLNFVSIAGNDFSEDLGEVEDYKKLAKLFLNSMLELYEFYNKLELPFLDSFLYVHYLNNSKGLFNRSICSAGNGSVGFSFDGNVVMCHKIETLVDTNVRKKYSFGNFLKRGEINESVIDANMDFQVTYKTLGCINCKAKTICFTNGMVPCKADNLVTTGSFISNPKICKFLRYFAYLLDNMKPEFEKFMANQINLKQNKEKMI